jgi:hypothetical protein
MQKIVADLEIIIGETGKSVAALQNIFSFKKKTIWMIQIIVGTIWKPFRADQKVISASPTKTSETIGNSIKAMVLMAETAVTATKKVVSVAPTVVRKVCPEGGD